MTETDRPLMAQVHPARWIGFAIGLILALAGSGCGYTLRPPYDQTVRTVYVPIFRSSSFSRDLNLQLTEAVIKEIQDRTPYRVVGRPQGADSTLTGEIQFVQKDGIVQSPENLPRGLRGRIAVQVRWVDNRAGGSNPIGSTVIDEAVNFFPEVGETQQQAYQRAIERLARQIVNNMEQPWFNSRELESGTVANPI